MPSEALWNWAWTIGGPFFAVCVALYLFYTNRIYTKKAYDDMVESKNKDIEEIKKQHHEVWGIVKKNLIITEKALTKAEDEVRRR